MSSQRCRHLDHCASPEKTVDVRLEAAGTKCEIVPATLYPAVQILATDGGLSIRRGDDATRPGGPMSAKEGSYNMSSGQGRDAEEP
jgi:hypothetical protein